MERGLHRIVGPDGVFMISMGLTDRFNGSTAQLAKVGIHPTLFPGTDGSDETMRPETQGVINWTSKLVGDFHMQDSSQARAYSALAQSHRRAMQAAELRSQEWTAIFEDDAVPVLKPGYAEREEWLQAFESAWALLPANAKLVRLGYCQQIMKLSAVLEPPSVYGTELQTYASGGNFRVTHYSGYKGEYTPGGCTTAYVIHRSIIPAMLALFPCPCTLDCCWQLAFQEKTPSGPWGQDFLFNIETQMSPDDLFYESCDAQKDPICALQFGVIQQDWKRFPGGTTEAFTDQAAKTYIQEHAETDPSAPLPYFFLNTPKRYK
jgi:hypothetical protein